MDRLVRLRNVKGETSRGQHHEGSVILDEEIDLFIAVEETEAFLVDEGAIGELGLLYRTAYRTVAKGVQTQRLWIMLEGP